MATVHYLKRSKGEAVLKIYSTNSAGETVDVDLADLATPDQTFDANNAIVTIKEIYWGAKKDKQIDITRADNGGFHGHYYLLNTGSYDFNGFVDDVYPGGNIRVIGDGKFHVVLKLNKTAGYTDA